MGDDQAEQPESDADPFLARLDHVEFSGDHGLAAFTLLDAHGAEVAVAGVWPLDDRSVMLFAEYDDGYGWFLVEPAHEFDIDTDLPAEVLARRAHAIGEILYANGAQEGWLECGVMAMVAVANCWDSATAVWTCSALASSATCSCRPEINGTPQWLDEEC